MKNGPQSPAGLNVVDFPSQLEKTKGGAEGPMHTGDRMAWVGGRRQHPGPSGCEGHRAQEASPYLQHFVSREAEFSEQQADVGEIHAQEGVALWAGLHRPAHWGRESRFPVRFPGGGGRCMQTRLHSLQVSTLRQALCGLPVLTADLNSLQLEAGP